MSNPSQNYLEFATLAMRLVSFAATLTIMGTFFLPWTSIDGMSRTSSGAELAVLLVTPTFNYLVAVSAIQAVILIGCPVLLIVSATMVMVKYARRKTAPLPTCLVFASSVLVTYGAPDLTRDSEFGAYVGLSLIVVLSATLLIHQSLITLRGNLYHRRKLPKVYQALSVLTGSGHYRWNEGSPARMD